MSPALIKSASAGMINVEPDVYHRIDPEFRAGTSKQQKNQTNIKQSLYRGLRQFTTSNDQETQTGQTFTIFKYSEQISKSENAKRQRKGQKSGNHAMQTKLGGGY